jgi:predicted nucleic acid-binding Zn ribbon protein
MIPPQIAQKIQKEANEEQKKQKELQEIYRQNQEEKNKVKIVLFGVVAITVIILVIF